MKAGNGQQWEVFNLK
jgi:hypothetical protein